MCKSRRDRTKWCNLYLHVPTLLSDTCVCQRKKYTIGSVQTSLSDHALVKLYGVRVLDYISSRFFELHVHVGVRTCIHVYAHLQCKHACAIHIIDLSLIPAGLSISMAVDPFENWVAVGTSLGYHVIWDMRFQLPIRKWQHIGHGGKRTCSLWSASYSDRLYPINM